MDFYFSFDGLAQNQATYFSLTDINGLEHRLYEDYFISFSGAWNMWGSLWVSTGAMQDFHDRYGKEEAVVLFIDPTGSSVDDLMGIESAVNNLTYDFVTGNHYPIIRTNGFKQTQ